MVADHLDIDARDDMVMAAAQRPAVRRPEIGLVMAGGIPLGRRPQHVARVVQEIEDARHLRQDLRGEAADDVCKLLLAVAALQPVGHLAEHIDDAAARLQLGAARDQLVVDLAQLGAGALIHRMLGAQPDGGVVEQLGQRAELVTARDGNSLREIAADYRFAAGYDPVERMLDEADHHCRRQREGD